MSQLLTVQVDAVAELTAKLAALKVLGSTEIKISARGTWRQVDARGELVFGADRVVRPLRGGRRVLAKVDGQEVVIEPWISTGRCDAYLVLQAAFP